MNYGREIRLPSTPDAALPIISIDNPASQQYYKNITDSIELAKKFMKEAQVNQAKYANKKRRDVHFKLGQLVLLSTANLNLEERAPKLADRYVGPFKIIEVIHQVNYKLDLPTSMKIHPVFHVSKLKSYQDPDINNNQFEREPIVNDQPEIINDEAHYEVEDILKHRPIRKKPGQYKYLVKWKNLPAYNNSWEPCSSFSQSQESVDMYNVKHRLNSISSIEAIPKEGEGNVMIQTINHH